jgi:hypothetical protein
VLYSISDHRKGAICLFLLFSFLTLLDRNHIVPKIQ